jgi:sec-independent protein translocase protein TatB
MLDLGWPELLLVGVITVMVVGPKELPRVLRSTLDITRKLRGLATEFQSGIGELAKQADLDDLKKDMLAVRKDTEGQMNVHELDSMLDPDNSVAGMFTGRPIRTPTPGEMAKKKQMREEAEEAKRVKKAEEAKAERVKKAKEAEAETPKLTAEPAPEATSPPTPVPVAEPPKPRIESASIPPAGPPKPRIESASIPPAGPPKPRIDPASIPPAGPPQRAVAAPIPPAGPPQTAAESPELEKRRAEA